MKRFYTVEKDTLNTRLDRWIKRNVCQIPQSLIEKNIRKGKIKINNLKKKVLINYKKTIKLFCTISIILRISIKKKLIDISHQKKIYHFQIIYL